MGIYEEIVNIGRGRGKTESTSELRCCLFAADSALSFRALASSLGRDTWTHAEKYAS